MRARVVNGRERLTLEPHRAAFLAVGMVETRGHDPAVRARTAAWLELPEGSRGTLRLGHVRVEEVGP
jgi:hypothetical protein